MNMFYQNKQCKNTVVTVPAGSIFILCIGQKPSSEIKIEWVQTYV